MRQLTNEQYICSHTNNTRETSRHRDSRRMLDARPRHKIQDITYTERGKIKMFGQTHVASQKAQVRTFTP